MYKVSKTPSRPSLTKLRLLHRALDFTSPNWMRTSTCRASWRAFLAPGSGWQQRSVKPAASPGARPRRQRLERMGNWAEDLKKLPEARLARKVFEECAVKLRSCCLASTGVVDEGSNSLRHLAGKTLRCQSRTRGWTARGSFPTQWLRPARPIAVWRSVSANAPAIQQ